MSKMVKLLLASAFPVLSGIHDATLYLHFVLQMKTELGLLCHISHYPEKTFRPACSLKAHLPVVVEVSTACTSTAAHDIVNARWDLLLDLCQLLFELLCLQGAVKA